jgi:hypothetical protein
VYDNDPDIKLYNGLLSALAAGNPKRIKQLDFDYFNTNDQNPNNVYYDSDSNGGTANPWLPFFQTHHGLTDLDPPNKDWDWLTFKSERINDRGFLVKVDDGATNYVENEPLTMTDNSRCNSVATAFSFKIIDGADTQSPKLFYGPDDETCVEILFKINPVDNTETAHQKKYYRVATCLKVKTGGSVTNPSFASKDQFGTESAPTGISIDVSQIYLIFNDLKAEPKTDGFKNFYVHENERPTDVGKTLLVDSLIIDGHMEATICHNRDQIDLFATARYTVLWKTIDDHKYSYTKSMRQKGNMAIHPTFYTTPNTNYIDINIGQGAPHYNRDSGVVTSGTLNDIVLRRENAIETRIRNIEVFSGGMSIL